MAILSGCAGGGGGGSAGSSGSSRTLTYTSASDFQTTEYSAQSGLGLVKASSMYYNGHYRWYAQNGGTGGNPSESTAGTGTNIKVAVADSGINAAEASTGSSIRIDTTNSYNYVDNTTGSASDARGHGTHVAGIIAAPMNSSGMHGIAYNATILNLRVIDATGTVTATDAQIGASATRSYNAGAFIINNSWGSTTAITSVTTAQLNASIPNSISAYQTYVANGGVAVWAAGNSSLTQVSYQAGLPYRISGLQAGWLAVVAVDPSGVETAYTNRCGVAAAWCLAAPGGGDNQAADGVYSMYNNGGYTRMSGTSMAAPMVSGAIAALKSMFPNLSYQDIAARLLTTANRTGIYATSAIYGQGLMDLEAASNPVGGLSLPTGSHTSGSLGSVSTSSITLPSSIAASMRNSRILLVDNYQKAPFWVPASSFIQESKIQSNFAVRHMNAMAEPSPIDIEHGEGMKFTQLQGLHTAMSIRQYGHSVGFASGVRSEQSLSRQLGLHYVPHLNDSSTNTNGFGYATNFGRTKVAVMSSMPNIQSGFNPNELNQNRSMMGSRTAFSFVSQREHENFAYGVTYSVANSFAQPLGLSSSGAFGLNNAQATSMGSFYTHSLFGGQTKLRTGVEMANFNTGSAGLVSFDNGKYAVFRVGADHFLSKKTALSLGFKQEQALSGQLTTKLPSTIDESGNIGYQSYASGFNNFLNSHQVNFDVHHRFNAASRIKGGLMYEQKPYGLSGAGAAIFYEHRL
ncbi:S8 family serine peptidase [Polynucleobacter sp. MWH-UH24A]|uniref:S8 family peptidase n=1 Tax=Polynucleobacter sp. MWH-UH24A TaxID=2689110 RepID=UPI001BFD8BD5|nr:S8 family peptidase [Polynucleobacter sp. MWH-UH24A]QWD76878.1 S8 family serine peptidase [Polynucleobacter sp. MWH-UH24A]